MSTFRKSQSEENAGFALVAALSIMAVLVLLGVALFSLASVATRSAEIAAAQTEAQANAKAALMMAIGDLQKYTGADTRVTAPADIKDPNAPAVVGAWKSWEGLNHVKDPTDPASGKPIAEINGTPIYDLKEISDASPNARFLSWLVSGNNGNLISPLDLVFEDASSDTIPLLTAGKADDPDDGSLSDNDNDGNPREVHVTPANLQSNGRFAWWVSPENQKARLAQPYEPRSTAPSDLIEMGQSHSVPNPEVFGFNNLNPEPFIQNAGAGGPVSRAINRDTLSLIDTNNSGEPSKRFHDLSTSAAGLLTNTATGGWRKDLSLLTEKWDEIYSSYPGGELPLFRYSPTANATSQVPKPTTSNYDPEQSNLYPWSEYSLILGYRQPSTYHAASASWASLQSFATSYKNFSYNSGVVKSPFVWDKIAKQRESSITSSEIYNYKHKQRLHPQIARFQFLVYARTNPSPTNPDRYEMWLKYVPVFTLWNPFNVALEHEISGTEVTVDTRGGSQSNFLGFGWRRAAPGAMAIELQSSYPNPDAVPDNRYKLLTNGNFQTLDWPSNYANPYDTFLPRNGDRFGYNSKWLDARTWGCWLPEGTLTLRPGEAKVISPDFIDPGYGFGGTAMRMKEGYSPSNIVGPEFRIKSNETIDRSYWFLFRPDRVTQPYRSREPGLGFSLSFGDGGSHFGGTSLVPSGIGNEYHNITALSSEAQGNAYWPPDEVDEIGYSVGELLGQWVPLFSTSFGPRMTIGTGPGTNQNRPTKGVVQNDALAAMVLSEPGSGDAKDHPVNNTFDFAYHSMSFGGNITPNLSEYAGYIATGYRSGDGLSRLITNELPLRPMASLVELQGWNPRGRNPYPPFQMNLIGNSDATPLIPQASVVPTTLEPSGVEFNLMHDDAYCANHLLFDDWFVSSIAPQSMNLGGSTAKSIETFYRDFLIGDDELSNRSYQAIPEDAGLTSSEALKLADDLLNNKNDYSGADGWLRVASRFIVDGMFNINSTSVDAWKALLGNARTRANLALYNNDTLTSTTATNKHAVTRGAAAFDNEAGTSSVVSGQFAEATEYTGFQSLSDEQIEDLAEKIVEQVRLRGPFLSLSEFINRQLSSDENLAVAGALQTAINNLDEDPMEFLRDPANKMSDKTMSDPKTTVSEPNKKLDGADYEFSKAAEGDSAYGAPGWIRQADILRPIAPVLSARDDTFTIRAYGDKLDDQGNVIAQAWCEAVVRRTRNFCDASDDADAIEPPTSAINTAFGRRYQIVNFRWLSPSEV